MNRNHAVILVKLQELMLNHFGRECCLILHANLHEIYITKAPINCSPRFSCANTKTISVVILIGVTIPTVISYEEKMSYLLSENDCDCHVWFVCHLIKLTPDPG